MWKVAEAFFWLLLIGVFYLIGTHAG